MKTQVLKFDMDARVVRPHCPYCDGAKVNIKAIYDDWTCDIFCRRCVKHIEGEILFYTVRDMLPRCAEPGHHPMYGPNSKGQRLEAELQEAKT